MSDDYRDPFLHPRPVAALFGGDVDDEDDDSDLTQDTVEAMFRLAEGETEQITNITTFVHDLGHAVAGLPGAWAVEAMLPRILQAARGREFAPATVNRVASMLSQIEGVLSQPALRGERVERARKILANARDELDWVEAAVRLLNG